MSLSDVHLQYRESVDSTNRQVMEWIASGCSHGQGLYAGTQTAGRGRVGRAWFSPPGVNLYLSVAITRGVTRARAPLLPLAVGTAVALELESLCGVEVELKWPNDLLIDGRKLGGVLCEGVSARNALRGIAVGLGLNVNLAPDDARPALRASLTSLIAETGRAWAIDDLASRCRRRIEDAADTLFVRGELGWLDELRQRDALAGSTVTFERGAEPGRGVAAGIADDGSLLVRDDAGELHSIRSGEVSVVRRLGREWNTSQDAQE